MDIQEQLSALPQKITRRPYKRSQLQQAFLANADMLYQSDRRLKFAKTLNEPKLLWTFFPAVMGTAYLADRHFNLNGQPVGISMLIGATIGLGISLSYSWLQRRLAKATLPKVETMLDSAKAEVPAQLQTPTDAAALGKALAKHEQKHIFTIRRYSRANQYGKLEETWRLQNLDRQTILSKRVARIRRQDWLIARRAEKNEAAAAAIFNYAYRSGLISTYERRDYEMRRRIHNYKPA